MLKVIVFAVVSAGIVFVSRASLGKRHSHGSWRFFAFESFLLLTLLNIEVWFRDPFSVHQIISWVLLLFSLILAVHGFYVLLTAGKPKGEVENTTVLVTEGAYKYIRHPLYCTLLLGAGGVFFKNPSLFAASLVLATSIFVVATAKTEESENLKKFGANYAVYMKTTKMFIPFLL